RPALAILNEIANLQIDILCADTKPVVNDSAIRVWHLLNACGHFENAFALTVLIISQPGV
ncbi:hypothetical protein FHS27_006351, partial [Rhodopirellula rubra]